VIEWLRPDRKMIDSTINLISCPRHGLSSAHDRPAIERQPAVPPSAEHQTSANCLIGDTATISVTTEVVDPQRRPVQSHHERLACETSGRSGRGSLAAGPSGLLDLDAQELRAVGLVRPGTRVAALTVRVGDSGWSRH